MSNYKPRIETNNLDLTSILSTINELPDAGPSVETCTVTITGYSNTDRVYCTTMQDGVTATEVWQGSGSVSNVVQGSILVIFANINCDYTITGEHTTIAKTEYSFVWNDVNWNLIMIQVMGDITINSTLNNMP